MPEQSGSPCPYTAGQAGFFLLTDPTQQLQQALTSFLFFLKQNTYNNMLFLCSVFSSLGGEYYYYYYYLIIMKKKICQNSNTISKSLIEQQLIVVGRKAKRALSAHVSFFCTQ